MTELTRKNPINHDEFGKRRKIIGAFVSAKRRLVRARDKTGEKFLYRVFHGNSLNLAKRFRRLALVLSLLSSTLYSKAQKPPPKRPARGRISKKRKGKSEETEHTSTRAKDDKQRDNKKRQPLHKKQTSQCTQSDKQIKARASHRFGNRKLIFI